ncbi:MAG: AtpZ/AtpI family protein [Candidatus Zixiibacteriota bacterium]
MSPESGSPQKKKSGRYGAAGIYITVPTLLAASILVGFFLGQWADARFGTEPYLMLLGLALGFGAAARQLFIMIKRAQAMEEKEDRK